MPVIYPCTVSWVPAVADLLNQELGEDCHSWDDVRELMDPGRGVALIALACNELVGAATAMILHPDDPEYWLVARMEEGGEVFDGPVGLLQSIAVQPEWRGQGLGTELACRRIEALRALGATAIVACSWEHGRPGRSRPILERLGFELVTQIEEAWKGQSCPVCGSDCRCGSSLMLLRV